MAKRSVALFRDKSAAKDFVKVIKAVKNEKTGAYTFKEEMVPADRAQEAVKS